MQKRKNTQHMNFDRSFTFGGYQWMASQSKKCGLNISAICRDALVTAIQTAGGKVKNLSLRAQRSIPTETVADTGPKKVRRYKKRA